jgi:uncharacterized caspase-like protein
MKIRGVFVGIDTYKDPNISRLQYAAADAHSLYRLFEANLEPNDRDVRLLTNGAAAKQTVMKAVGEDLARVTVEDDIVVLFFAGHGSPETGGSLDTVSRYLVLHDTEYENIFATGLDMEHELPRLCFDRIRAKLVILFVDACFSGRSGGRTFEGVHLLRSRLHKGIRGAINLSKLELGEGRVIITASDDDEVARESADLGHGVFTYYLIQTLERADAGNPSISITSLYDAVSGKVHEHTAGRQHPVLNGRTRLGKLPVFATDRRIA